MDTEEGTWVKENRRRECICCPGRCKHLANLDVPKMKIPRAQIATAKNLFFPGHQTILSPIISAGWRAALKYWRIFRRLFVIISILITYILFTYMASYDHRQTLETLPLLLIFYICDVIYLLDSIRRAANIKYKVKGLPFKNRIPYFLESIVDFISLIPLEIFVLVEYGTEIPQANSNDWEKDPVTNKNVLKEEIYEKLLGYYLTIVTLKVNRLLRLYRIPVFYKQQTEPLELNTFLREIFATLVCFFCFLIITIHGIACIWYHLTCNGIVHKDNPPKCVSNPYPYSENDEQVNDVDPFGLYLGGVHWAVMSIRNAGNQQLDSTTQSQMVNSIVIQLFGFILLWIISVVSLHLVTLTDFKRNMFFHYSNATVKLAKQVGLTRPVRSFMKKCLNYMWHENCGFANDELLKILPNKVKAEVMLDIMQPMVDASEILQKYMTDSDLELIAAQLTLEHIFANEFIIRPHSRNDSMIYIHSGSVDIMDDKTIPPVILYTMGKGSLIGETDVFLPSHRVNGVRTRESSDVFIIPHQVISKVYSLHPGLEDELVDHIRSKFSEEDIEPIIKLDDLPYFKEQPSEKEQASNKPLSKEEQSKHYPEYLFIQDTEIPALEEIDISPVKNEYKSIYLGTLCWLRHLGYDPERLRKGRDFKVANLKTVEASEFGGVNRDKIDEDGTWKKYKFIPSIPYPNYDWGHLAVSNESMLFYTWEIFVIFIALLYSFVYPLTLLINDRSTFWIEVVDDIVNFLDILLQLLVFFDVQEMYLQIPKRKAHIFKELRKPRIILDLIPVIPLRWIAEAVIKASNYRTYLYWRAHIFIFKFIRVHLYFKKWEHDVRISTWIVRLLKHIVYLGIYVVLISSLFCCTACISPSNCQSPGGESWVDKFVERHPSEGYVTKNFPIAFEVAVYWTICNTFGVNYYDVLVVKKTESTLYTFSLFLSYVIVTYFFADFGSCISGAIESKVHHQGLVIWLRKYLQDQLTEKSIMDQINWTFDIQWRVFHGLNTGTNKGFLSVNKSMFREVLIYMVSNVLTETPFFRYVDLQLLRDISLVSSVTVLPPGSVLMLEGDPTDSIFLIRRGYVEVYKGDTNRLIDILSSGQSIGEINMIHGVPMRVTIRSVTHVEIIEIRLKDIQRILSLSEMHEQDIDEIQCNKKAFSTFQNVFTVTQEEFLNDKHSPKKVKSETTCFYCPCENVSENMENSIKVKNYEYYKEKFLHSPIKRFLRFILLPVSINPNGLLIKYWETIRVHTILIAAILIPLTEAYPYFKIEFQSAVYCYDFITFVDMLVHLHTGYFDSKTRCIHEHPMLNAKHYFLTAFPVDFISSLPAYVIIDSIFPSYGFKGKEDGYARIFAFILRLNRLLPIYRYWYYLQSRKLASWSGKNNMRILVLMMILIMFHVHIMACIAIVMACPINEKDLRTYPSCYPDTWLTTSKNKHKVLSAITGGHQIYLYAFYYTATTVAGCGFGDFRPFSEFEKSFTSIIFFCYIILFTYFLATFGSSRCHWDYKFLHYQLNMKYLATWFARENVDLRLTKALIQHYDYQWLRTTGILPKYLWPSLFPSLRRELSVEMFQDIVRLIPEFNQAPTGLIREICCNIQIIYFLNQQIVARKGEVCEYIYFVAGGNLIINMGNSESLILGDGGIIGSMDPNVKHAFFTSTVVTWSYADIYQIKRRKFLEIIEAFPFVRDNFIVRGQHTKRETEIFSKFFKEDGTYSKNAIKLGLEMTRITKASILAITFHKELAQAEKENEPELLNDSDEEDESLILNYKRFSELPLKPNVLTKPSESAGNLHDETLFPAKEMTPGELLAKSLLPVSEVNNFLNALYCGAGLLSVGLTLYQFTFSKFDTELWVLAILMDCVFIVKMVCGFFLSTYDELVEYVTHGTQFRTRYVSSYDGFIMDCCSTMPLDLFTFVYVASLPENTEELHQSNQRFTTLYLWAALRLNRLIRVHYVYKYLVQSVEVAGLNQHLLFTKLRRLIIFTLFGIHLLACIFYLSTISFRTFDFSCDCNIIHTHATIYTENDTKHEYNCTKPANYTPEAWLFSKSDTTHSVCSPYTTTLYFLINVFTTTSYGDIYAVRDFELVFISLIAISSRIWVGLALSDILSGLQNYVLTTYQLGTSELMKLYENYGITDSSRDKMKRYYENAWIQNRGVLTPEFLIEAPGIFRYDIFKEVYGDLLRSSYLFEKLPMIFIKYVATRLKQFWILEGDYIIKQDDYDDKLYFIHRGVVEAIHQEYYHLETGEEYTYTLKEKSVFGELNGIVSPRRSYYTYRAQSKVDLVYLTHEDINEIVEIFPEIKQKLIKRLIVKHGDDLIQTQTFKETHTD